MCIRDRNGKLTVTNTPNGVNPIANGSGIPILGCDVWEHSYYVDYRNVRPDYVKAFIDNMVNWDKVAEILEKNSCFWANQATTKFPENTLNKTHNGSF